MDEIKQITPKHEAETCWNDRNNVIAEISLLKRCCALL